MMRQSWLPGLAVVGQTALVFPILLLVLTQL